MIKAIVIDDDPIATKVISNFCKEFDFIELVKSFNKPLDGLKYLNKFPVDLLFLDINMPEMNGLELSKKLKQNTMIIFTTAHSKFAVEGFNLNASDYLVKPFSFERFKQAVTKCFDTYKLIHNKAVPGNQYLFVRADYSLIKIKMSDILYIEGLDDYLKIYIKDSKTIVARQTMKGVLEKLPKNEFIRVHRSFIVPFNKISSVRKKMIYIGEKEIPIGNSFEEDFFRIYKM